MEEKKTREIRTYGGKCQPRLREAADGKESRTIEGYAIVFGVESQLICDWYDTYREIIEPGAVTIEELNTMDIKMTLFHNREKLIARSNKGEGTLKLSVDETGVKYEFDAPHTPDGDTAIELVRRGDLAGSSFTFWCDEKSSIRYEMMDDGTLLRHVDHIDRVFEMTIASDPAYQQTTATAREVAAHGIQLPGRKTAEVDEAKLRENREQIERLRRLANHQIY